MNVSLFLPDIKGTANFIANAVVALNFASVNKGRNVVHIRQPLFGQHRLVNLDIENFTDELSVQPNFMT